MTPDQIMAAPIFIGLGLLLVNSWALFKDGVAEGVRPYFCGWVFICNAIVASQMAQIGQLWTAAAMASCGIVNGINAALIAYFRWRQAQ